MQVENRWKERFEKLKQKVNPNKGRDFFLLDFNNKLRVKDKKELWDLAQRKIKKIRLYWQLLTKKSK